MNTKPYWMRPWDEVVGKVKEVNEIDSYSLVLIGKVPVYLPKELGQRLRESIDKRVGVLRTDTDYRFRVISPTDQAIEAGSTRLVVVQGAI